MPSSFGQRLAGAIADSVTGPVRRSIPRRGYGRFGAQAGAMAFASADGTAIHADVLSPREAARGTVVLAHGWRDGRGQLGFLAPRLVAKGFRVVALDFRAHGKSGGARVTIGVREADDVRAALDAVRGAGGGGASIGFLGYSMGASAYLLSGAEADAAVLDSPYDSLDGAVAARVRRLRLPPSFAGSIAAAAEAHVGVPLAGVRPIDAVAGLTRPTLFVFARFDPWIGAATRAAFAERLPVQSEMRVVLGGHHLHFGPRWQRDVVGFFDRALARA